MFSSDKLIILQLPVESRRSGCTSYIDISFYKVNKYFGYTRNLGYKTIDFSASRSSYKDEKEAYNAIKQAKEWFKKKQKL